MAANSAFPINFKDRDTDTIIGTMSVSPSRDRNGIYEYSGYQNNGNQFSASPTFRLTASVRPGTAANYIQKVARVKQRVTIKMAFPVDVPGETGDVVDYINIDVIVSSPIEVTDEQTQLALSAVEGCAFSIPGMPLRDLLVNGREPY